MFVAVAGRVTLTQIFGTRQLGNANMFVEAVLLECLKAGRKILKDSNFGFVNVFNPRFSDFANIELKVRFLRITDASGSLEA